MTLFTQPYVSGYLGYFMAGYILGKREFSTKVAWISIGLVFLLVLGKTLWIYQLTHDGGRFDTDLFDYLKWDVILLSLAGFIGLKHTAQRLEIRLSPALTTGLVTASRATYGIYFIHIMVLKVMDQGLFGIRFYSDSFLPLIAVPLTVLLAFIISFIVIFPLQRIPLIKKIVP